MLYVLINPPGHGCVSHALINLPEHGPVLHVY